MSNNKKHRTPSSDKDFDAADSPADSPKELESGKQEGPYANMTQAQRDAHFYENGVKADGTGGKAPEDDA